MRKHHHTTACLFKWAGFILVLAFPLFGNPSKQTASGPPKTLSYQGILTHLDGSSIPDGTYSITFSLYDVETGGTALWTETQSVSTQKGIFNVILGSSTPLSLPFDKPYWLGIKVGSDPEMVPRIALTSTAYSFYSTSSGPHATSHQEGGTDPVTVTTGMIQDNAVTVEKIQPNVVSSINGVVNDGGNIDLVAGSNVTITPDDANNRITISASGGGGGDITAVIAGNGLVGGGTSGDVTLNAQAGTGIIVESDIIRLDETYTDGRYVNEGQADAITSAMIQNGTIQGEDINTSTTITAGKIQGGGTTLSYCGVYGTGNVGVRGEGTNYGVYGGSSSVGVYGSGSLYSVYGHGGSYAGYFNGDVRVVNNFSVGGTKSFKIDHPLNPEGQYLNHFCVESNEVQNIYNGNVILDSKGEAWVELPRWFEALNKDFRYQLTCIGGFAPVYIAQEISGNRFKIAGGSPGMKVSWQVTGIRHDPYVEAHPIPVEEDKPLADRGKYLHPKEYGKPETMGVDYDKLPKMEGIK